MRSYVEPVLEIPVLVEVSKVQERLRAAGVTLA